MNIGVIIFWLLIVTCASVGWDLWSYEARQYVWEIQHPGSTYIRNYKRKIKKGQL